MLQSKIHETNAMIQSTRICLHEFSGECRICKSQILLLCLCIESYCIDSQITYNIKMYVGCLHLMYILFHVQVVSVDISWEFVNYRFFPTDTCMILIALTARTHDTKNNHEKVGRCLHFEY